MSSSTGSTVDSSMQGSWSFCGSRCGSRRSHSGQRERWSGTNIAFMVLGFVFFWPVGLLLLGWILSGRQVRDLPGAIRGAYIHFFGTAETRFASGSDNVVFNEYQQTQYDRIREIKNEIGRRADNFKSFREDAQRRADQEEFDRFMASAPISKDRGE